MAAFAELVRNILLERFFFLLKYFAQYRNFNSGVSSRSAARELQIMENGLINFKLLQNHWFFDTLQLRKNKDNKFDQRVISSRLHKHFHFHRNAEAVFWKTCTEENTLI